MTCIVSPLPKDKDGYPRLKHQGKMMIASRLVWYVLYGKIPDDKLVCHTCDNPSCVNPEHLYLGSFEDNMRDKVIRGRVSGDNHPRSKIKEEQIAAMLWMSANGFSQQRIADAYCISQSHVSAILSGKRLKTIGDNR